MIPFDFEYYRPDSISQTVDLFMSLTRQAKKPMYYGGGTEIISMARANNIYTGGVIDIKGIPECNKFGYEGTDLVIGAATTLTKISDSNLFPMLGITVARIADHTIQGKITLGGNITGTIMYREASLPLLIADCRLSIAGPGGTREALLSQVFDRRIRLEEGEFITHFIIDSHITSLPFFHRKATKIDKIDYPLITVVALKKDNRILVGFSGLCDFPFRSLEMEDSLNQPGISKKDRIQNAMAYIPAPIVEDIHGSAMYRRFVLENILSDALEL